MANEKKQVIFVRRHKGLGIFSITIGGEEIRIVDRGIYSSSDAEEISALKADPEVEIWKTSDPKLDRKMAEMPKDAEMIEEPKKSDKK